MAIEEKRSYCKHHGIVLARRQAPGAEHLVHLVLTLLTAGLWLFVWIFASISYGRKPFLCPTCGGKTVQLKED